MQQCFRPLEIAHPTLQVMVSTNEENMCAYVLRQRK